MDYREVWVIDTEFYAPDGETPLPICLVAQEIRSGRRIEKWLLDSSAHTPLPDGEDVLQVAYYSSAEWGCYLALGWGEPRHIVDLYAEFRNMTNGKPLPSGKSLLGATVYFGIDGMAASHKDVMRDRIIRGPPFTQAEQQEILDYCGQDVDLTVSLYRVMESRIDFPRALIRGAYMWTAAKMERTGIPVDIDTLGILLDNWEIIQDRLISEVNPHYGIYEGRTFKLDAFDSYLASRGIPWPRTPAGHLSTADSVFKDMASAYPELLALKELRATLSQLKLHSLAVGKDGCNRCLLSGFGAKSGRNTPSNAKFIFGPAVWLRFLIRPEPGEALAYIDFEQEEFGIAAALSGDRNMKVAYESGDPYLTFGKQSGVIPPGATKQSHRRERDLFKTCVIGTQYGMGPESLAKRIGKPVPYAKELLDYHRLTYRRYWTWSDGIADRASLYGKLQTCFGWNLYLESGVCYKNERSVRNFPLQAHGAEILRIASILLNNAGIEVCAPVHDAFLIRGPDGEIEEITKKAQALMEQASREVLNGFTIRTDVKIIHPGERYSDPRGQEMWDRITGILETIQRENTPSEIQSVPAIPGCAL